MAVCSTKVNCREPTFQLELMTNDHVMRESFQKLQDWLCGDLQDVLCELREVIVVEDTQPAIEAVTGVQSNTYGESVSVASGGTSIITSLVVPAGKNLLLDLVEFSGTNISEYSVKIAGVVQAKKHTCFGGDYFGQFDFEGLQVASGVTVLLEVENFRPESGDYFGRILGRLVTL